MNSAKNAGDKDTRPLFVVAKIACHEYVGNVHDGRSSNCKIRAKLKENARSDAEAKAREKMTPLREMTLHSIYLH